MKTHRLYRIIWLFFLMAGWTAVQAQDQAEVPGDNFSLEGALTLFKKSSSPQEFEKMLNDPQSKVNNLDLNGDGYIDYIRVIDRYEGNVHAFTLQAVVSKKESQDVAVITLEKLDNGKAVLQIIGDEDIYGVETIIEPTREVRTYGGTMSARVVVDVWAWPFVQYVYGPVLFSLGIALELGLQAFLVASLEASSILRLLSVLASLPALLSRVLYPQGGLCRASVQAS